MRIYAVVEEKDEHVFVTTLTERQMETMGEDEIETFVRDWCERQNPPLTFVDYA